ncbi:TetR/AcrR family transcriptional regulator [Metabacillus lacus]|nr:TetR/AcrR family transcriptional regulator [Metabacillus lacus]
MKKSGFDLRREKKMKDIEEATLKLLNERDLSHITIDEIAKGAGVSKVTIFNYYSTKDNLINTSIHGSLASSQKELETLVYSDLSFEQTYHEITKYKMSRIHQYTPVFFHNLIKQFSSDPDFYNSNMQKENEELVLKLFQKGRNEGKINPAYSDEVLLLYMHIFTEGMKSGDIPSENLKNYGTLISQMFLNGLR